MNHKPLLASVFYEKPRSALLLLSAYQELDPSRIPPEARRYEDALLHQVLLRFIEHWVGANTKLIIDRNVILRLVERADTALISFEMLSARINQFVPNSAVLGLGL